MNRRKAWLLLRSSQTPLKAKAMQLVLADDFWSAI
jgi:hypothetical protein